MGADWISYADVLPVNRAMPFWLDIAPGEEIDPFTLAWAQGSGWLWKIPTARRYGCGYVYSDLPPHPGPGAGRDRDRASATRSSRATTSASAPAGSTETWIGNCVALGLSSAFLEPLEATSIHGTVVQLMLLTTLLGKPSPKNPERYNAAVARQVDDFRDFIRLHYVSERRDTPFWRDVAASHPRHRHRERLELWSRKTPGPEDFAAASRSACPRRPPPAHAGPRRPRAPQPRRRQGRARRPGRRSAPTPARPPPISSANTGSPRAGPKATATSWTPCTEELAA